MIDYCATHPDTTIRYYASAMQLVIYSNRSYLSGKNSKSCAAGHHYLSNSDDEKFKNGSILTLSTIIKHVMVSAAETELAAMFYNACKAIPLKATLEELAHRQVQPTPVTIKYTTAHGLTIGSMIPRRSKPMDMRFQWLKGRE